MIDVDCQPTWPDPVTAWASAAAAGVRGHARNASDLPIPLEREDEFRSLLSNEKLLAYHATRLLDHEVDRVAVEGLRRLDESLVRSRILSAHEHGYFDVDVRDLLLRSHVFAQRVAAARAGQICLVLGRSGFESAPTGCDDLMSIWGGEGLYMGAVDVEPLTRGLGRPALVIVQIDLSVPHEAAPSFPTLSRLFVGALGAEQVIADVFFRADIPPSDVVAIVRPGDPEYDRHPGLPRE